MSEAGKTRGVPSRSLMQSGLIAVLCAVLLTGCGQPVTKTDATQYPQAVAVYEMGCNTCHGENLEGGIGPALQHVGSSMTLAQIERQIQVGGGPMPAYAAKHDAILTPAQIVAVATWLATKK